MLIEVEKETGVDIFDSVSRAAAFQKWELPSYVRTRLRLRLFQAVFEKTSVDLVRQEYYSSKERIVNEWGFEAYKKRFFPEPVRGNSRGFMVAVAMFRRIGQKIDEDVVDMRYQELVDRELVTGSVREFRNKLSYEGFLEENVKYIFEKDLEVARRFEIPKVVRLSNGSIEVRDLNWLISKERKFFARFEDMGFHDLFCLT